MAVSGVIPDFACRGSSFPCSMKRFGQPMRTTGVFSPKDQRRHFGGTGSVGSNQSPVALASEVCKK